MIKKMSKKMVTVLMITLCVSFATTYIAFAAPLAKMKASVETPKLRGAYVSPANANPANIKLEGDVSLSRGKQIISVSLRDSDVKQALRMFADKAGLNIIFHNSVGGKITLDLVNVTLNDAFKMIMQMSELTYVIDKDTIMVMSAEASKNIDVSKENMSTIPVKYVDASAVAQFLNKNVFSINKPGLSNSEIVVTNPIKNELLVFGTDNDYKMAKKIVEKIDTKPAVTTFKVNHTTPREMATLICQTLFAPVAAPTAPSSSTMATSVTTTATTAVTPVATPVATPGAPGAAPPADLIIGGSTLACRVTPMPSVSTGSKMAPLMNNYISVTYKQGLGTVSLIGGTPEQIAMVNDFISTNDKKQPQALVEVSVVELTENGSKDFTNNWQIASNFFTANFSPSGLSTNSAGNNSYPMFWRGSGLTYVDEKGTVVSNLLKYHGPFTVSQNINYLITNGKGRVLANPKVMVTNGKTSVIDLTSDYVQSVTSQVMASNGVVGAVQKTYTIGKDNGMKIQLTPFISPDGYVSMNLKPEYATIKETVKDSLTKDPVVTLLQRRNLDLSNVRIKDGETLAIGGLIQEEETQQVAKIPILGDLPGIGVFFRNSNKTSNKTELVIMITPRIVVDTEDVTRL